MSHGDGGKAVLPKTHKKCDKFDTPKKWLDPYAP